MSGAISPNNTEAIGAISTITGEFEYLESTNGALNTTGGGGGGGDVNLVSISGSAITLGQKTMASSLPVVIASNQSAITTTETPPSTLVAFVTDIPTAGTRVQLASNSVIAVIIQAPSTNTGSIYVGGSTVSNTVYGSQLLPGQSVGLAIDNTNKIYVDTATNGNDVAIFGSV